MKKKRLPPEFTFAGIIVAPSGVFNLLGKVINGIAEFENRGASIITHDPFRFYSSKYVKNYGKGFNLKDFVNKIKPRSRQENINLVNLLKFFPQRSGPFLQEFKPEFLPYGQDYLFKCSAQFAYIDQNGKKRIVLFQTHKNYVDKLVRFGLVAAMARIRYCKNDFKDALIQIVDCGVPPSMKGRRLKVYNEEDLPKFSEQQVDAALALYVAAREEMEKEGFQPRKTQKKRPPKDPRQQDLWP